ncbi:hypothetical protein DMN91_002889 [Ooceraea biroi]|uniref:Integrase catalytic domain-containing protein n=1 Tax=Ooceraea biroi TaxID=2015173 RepID=A0A3L8DXY0_OOCBI|nr:uncharacterized protein LOC105278128 [Ooceraea biroi]RLU24799.1 hypothetical protein DMN91_002889 [Ooceraea biroi]
MSSSSYCNDFGNRKKSFLVINQLLLQKNLSVKNILNKLIPVTQMGGSWFDSRSEKPWRISAAPAQPRATLYFDWKNALRQTPPPLKNAYSKFLREYRELGHMRLVTTPGLPQQREFFLPHHGVTRESSSTTKLQVVFNGSQKTSLRFSLNDELHVGPKLQTELTNVLTRWRQHPYVFAADIEKMYRQIRVHEKDWPIQKILWRNSSAERIQEYYLCTVTYGLTCASYLALKCVRKLALNSASTHPLAYEILLNDIYVDDVFSGASDLTLAKERIRQVNAALKAGGFNLRKWIANDPAILEDIPRPDHESSSTMKVEDTTSYQTLGIVWNRESDSFVFSAPAPLTSDVVSKRSVLSFTARMFDPLGWLAPILVVAKIFMQELWAIRLDWDNDLPEELASRWIKFTQTLAEISTISIPRWLGTDQSTIAIELHGFSDASQRALGAVIYSRIINQKGEVRVVLVSAKTKVAPLKRMTVPRLELSAVVLLTRQVLQLRETLELRRAPIHLWTDSTVALTWIKSHPSRWKDFVSHRVSFIQDLPNSRWHHISGRENPADLASRGTSPQHLQSHQLWWTGPHWLRNRLTSWPNSTPDLSSSIDLEEKPRTCATATDGGPEIWNLIDRYSTLTPLRRLTAWLFRARECWQRARNAPSRRTVLTTEELEYALLFWVKTMQQAYFPQELRALRDQRTIATSSNLSRLCPILNSNGLLRLRGRLRFSQLDPSEKHPLILPRQSRLTTLVIDYYHRRTLHGGPQLTSASIRQKFWIIGGRLPIRSFIHRCIPCCRQRAITSQQLIGQLPASRVTPCRPFYHSGVDYAGPLILKTFRGRGFKTYKGYFIIFVCFSTSAVHLEVATDYSTDGFLAAYKRFTSRRGLCATITSDCGTNLIGADAELKRMFSASSKEWSHLANLLANDGVTWKFNSPAAPHFGGKWESGVKSVKHHLRRVVGDTRLTYEELSTLLAQIETILNSRPLGALTDDPLDASALTPGHFLVGSALTTVPEPSLSELPPSRLSRLQLIRRMLESFWQRWASEYLHQL